MPPKKKGAFLVPGTPASKKKPGRPPISVAKESTLPVTGDYSGKNGKRNIVNEFQAEYADPSKLQSELAALSIKHLRPLAPSTLSKYDRARRLWLAFFEWLYGDADRANATLAEEAELPPAQEVKLFIGNLAKKGRSGLQMSLSGWSYHTARDFLLSIEGMRKRHYTKPASKAQLDDLINYLRQLANVEKVLTTAKKPKRKLRLTDIMEFTAAVINPSLNIMNNYLRIEAMCFGCMLFALGIRPGTVLEHPAYAGTGQVLKWKDMDWIITGWDEGVGMGMETFIRFNWMKNMRMDDSLFMQTSIRSLGKEKITICTELLLEVMAIHNDIFVEDVIGLRKDKEKVLALELPYSLNLKKNALDLPVFTQRRGRAENFVPRVVDESIIPVASSSSAPSKPVLTPAQMAREKRARRKTLTDPCDITADPCYTAPMTMSTMTHITRKIGKALGWMHFSMKSYRYSYCSDMTGKISEQHLNYFMGHKPNVKLTHTTYQVPDHNINNSGLRFNESQDTSTGDFHSSVACGRNKSSINVPDQVLFGSPTMSILIEVFKKADAKVLEKYNMSSMDIQFKNDPLVEDAQEAWADILRSYAHLATGANLEKAVPKSRARSASITSDMSTTSDPVPGPSRGRSSTPADTNPRSRSGSDVSMTSSTSRQRARLLKAKPKVIFDSDEEIDDTPAADPSDSDDEHASSLKRAGKMKAVDLSDESAEEKDPINDPAIREKIDTLVATALSGLSDQHPYLEAIASENENPRLIALGLYLGLLKADALQKHGICKFCFLDPTKSTKDRLRNWTDKLGIHLWMCEDNNSPGFWRCPCCGHMVQCGDPDPTTPLSADEIEAVVADLNVHREACYEKTLVQLGLKPETEEEEEEDNEDEEPPRAESDNPDDEDFPIEAEGSSDDEGGKKNKISKSSFGTGYLRLAVATRLAGARCAVRRLFCPICFFLSPDDKCQRAKREGDDDVRFKVFLNAAVLRQHIISHWSSQKRSEIGGIAYENVFKCGFLECQKLSDMKTGKMITHLHNEHDYQLVECSIEHEHTPACFELPESRFYYITDAKLIHAADKTPLPSTTLREFRRVNLQKTQAKKIAASHGSSTNDSTMASSEESDTMSITTTSTSLPASVASTSSMPALLTTTSTSTSVTASAVESANATQIRACMTDFALAYPNAVDVEKITEILVDLDMSVGDWASIADMDLKAMDICWTPRDLVRWKTFVKKLAVLHKL